MKGAHMESTLKKRIAIGAGSVALGAVIAFVAVPAVVRQGNRTEAVVRIKSGVTVSAGEKITQNMVSLDTVLVKGQPADAEKSLSNVIGHYAKSDLYAADTVTPAKLSENVQSVPDGLQEISVAIKSVSDGFTGQLQAGDIVSIYGVTSTSGADGSFKLDALRYVKVLGYFNGSTSSSSSSSVSTTNATVTLQASEK